MEKSNDKHLPVNEGIGSEEDFPEFEGSDSFDPEAQEFLSDVAQKSVRLEQFEKLVEKNRSGEWRLPYASSDYGADLEMQANRKHMWDTYPFLHKVSGGIGFDADEFEEGQDLGDVLDALDEDTWDQFIRDVENLKDFNVLDEGTFEELRNEEEARWATDDGVPDMRRAVRRFATDSFTAFKSKYVKDRLVWEYCQEQDQYPEIEEATAYLDLYDLAEEDAEEFIEWFKQNVDVVEAEAVAEWDAVKRAYLNSETFKKVYTSVLDEAATIDPEFSALLGQLDGFYESAAEVLLDTLNETVPDSNYGTDLPAWRPVRNRNTDSARSISWMIFPAPGENWRGFPPDVWSIEDSIGRNMLRKIVASGRFRNKLVRLARKEPKEHPELPLGESDETAGDDNDGYVPEIDDPDILGELTGRGMFALPCIYEDSTIRVYKAETMQEWEEAVSNLTGKPLDARRHKDRWYGDIFVVLDSTDGSHIASYVLADYSIKNISGTKIYDLLQSQKHGMSTKKAFLRILVDIFYDTLEGEDYDEVEQLIGPLEIVGGSKVVTKLLTSFSNLTDQYSLLLGCYAMQRGQYDRAAILLGMDRSQFEAGGVQLRGRDWSTFAWVFYDSDSASEILNNGGVDNVYIEDWPYDLDYTLPYVSAKAKAYIRDLLVNRVINMPGAEKNQVLVTREFLKDYTDEELWDWVVNPSEEDLDSGVFDDIRNALKTAGVRMLEALESDAIVAAYREAILDAIGATSYKWVSAPASPTSKKSTEYLALVVPYGRVTELMQNQTENGGYGRDESFYALFERELIGTVDNNRGINYDSSLPRPKDENYEFYKDFINDEILDLELTPEPVDPNQSGMPLGESLEDEQWMSSWLSNDLADLLSSIVPEKVSQMLELIGRKTEQVYVNVEPRGDDIKGRNWETVKIAYHVDPGLSMADQFRQHRSLTSIIQNAAAEKGYVTVKDASYDYDKKHSHNNVEHRWAVVKDNNFNLSRA